MLPEHYEELAMLDEDYWWFRVKFHCAWRIIRSVNPKPEFLLDVGCGTGGFLKRTLDQHILDKSSLLGVESETIAVQIARQRGVPVVQAEGVWELVLPQIPDVITLFDVLEHIGDPVLALRSLRECCRPGGHLLVFVPAMQRLWSRWDELMGHYRRYNRTQLLQELNDSGWLAVHSRYLFSAMVFAGFFRRKFIQRHANHQTQFPRVPSVVNRMLTGYCIAESYLSALPFGTTLVALARNMKGVGA